jgi:voltage-gated potassium channel
MTTVGYGDLYPTTPEGRVIGILVMLVGIGFIAILTGAVAQRFLSAQVEAIEADITHEGDTVAEVLFELRAIRDRLGELEARVGRLGVERSR